MKYKIKNWLKAIFNLTTIIEQQQKQIIDLTAIVEKQQKELKELKDILEEQEITPGEWSLQGFLKNTLGG